MDFVWFLCWLGEGLWHMWSGDHRRCYASEYSPFQEEHCFSCGQWGLMQFQLSHLKFSTCKSEIWSLTVANDVLKILQSWALLNYLLLWISVNRMDVFWLEIEGLFTFLLHIYFSRDYIFILVSANRNLALLSLSRGWINIYILSMQCGFSIREQGFLQRSVRYATILFIFHSMAVALLP